MASLDPAIFEIIVQIRAKAQARSHSAISHSDVLNEILFRALQRHPALNQEARNPPHYSAAKLGSRGS
jgi:hypothetical protein